MDVDVNKCGDGVIGARWREREKSIINTFLFTFFLQHETDFLVFFCLHMISTIFRMYFTACCVKKIGYSASCSWDCSIYLQ